MCIRDRCYYIVEYGGAITKVPITIKENDIESISLFVEADSEERKIDCDADIEKKIDGIVAVSYTHLLQN